MRKITAVGLVMAMVSMVVPAGLSAATLKAPAARQPQQTGTVKGEAKDEKGRKLAAVKVRVRNSSTGVIAAEVLSDESGGFVAAGLAPAGYIVEVVNAAGHVIGLSPVIAVAAGTTATITVTASAVLGAAAAAAGGGVGVLGLGTAASVIVVGGAATAAIVGLTAFKKKNASPSGL